MLPKLNKLKVTVTSPVTKQAIQISPFTVAEQKILAMVNKSGSQTDILGAMIDVISNCSNVKISSLSTVELQWLALEIRNLSSGSKLDVTLKCGSCGKETPTSIDLKRYTIEAPEPMERQLILNEADQVGVLLRPLDLIALSKMNDKDDLAAFRLAVESVFDKDNVYPISEVSDKDLEEFADSIPVDKMEYILKWVYNVGKMYFDLKWTCPHCNTENELHVEGIQDFFH
jgi:hypothetical protein